MKIWFLLVTKLQISGASFLGCHTDVPHMGRLKTMDIYSLTVLEARSPKSRCGKGILPPRSLGGALSSSLPAVIQTPRILFLEHRLRTSEDDFQLVFLCSDFLPGRVLSVWRPWTMSLLFRRVSLTYVEHPENNIGLCESLWDEFHTLGATGTEKRERSYGWEQPGTCFWGCGTWWA